MTAAPVAAAVAAADTWREREQRERRQETGAHTHKELESFQGLSLTALTAKRYRHKKNEQANASGEAEQFNCLKLTNYFP